MNNHLSLSTDHPMVQSWIASTDEIIISHWSEHHNKLLVVLKNRDFTKREVVYWLLHAQESILHVGRVHVFCECNLSADKVMKLLMDMI